jgi:tetratricopeptide (TPR) repeat protein
LARWVASKQRLVEVLVVAATAEAQAGNTKSSLELLSRARADAVFGGPTWALAELVEAQAFLAAGAHRRAWRLANEAAECMAAIGMERYSGAALSIAAQAAEAVNEREEAIRTICEAIRILESYGHAASLARAYACSARLTQSRRHASRARELLELLQQPN